MYMRNFDGWKSTKIRPEINDKAKMKAIIEKKAVAEVIDDILTDYFKSVEYKEIIVSEGERK